MATKAPRAPKVRLEKEKGQFVSLPVFLFTPVLSLSLFVCLFVCFPAVMGSFEEGERTQSVSQGEGGVIRAPLIRSFPQPQVTWFRDGRKIPPSSRM